MIRIIFLTFLFIPFSFAQDLAVKRLSVVCGKSPECESINNSFKSLRRSYSSHAHLRKILKLYLLNEGIKNFRYELWEENGEVELKLYLVTKKVAYEVAPRLKRVDQNLDPNVFQRTNSFLKRTFTANEYDIELPTILPLKEGDFIDEIKISKTIDILQNVLTAKGFPDANIQVVTKQRAQGTSVYFVYEMGKPIKVDNIRIRTKNEFLKSILYRRLSTFSKQPFDLQSIKDVIDEANLLFRQYGYYINEIPFRYRRNSKYSVSLFLEIKDNDLHVFNVKGNEKLSQKEIKESLVNYVTTYKKPLNIESAKQVVLNLYRSNGFLNTEVDVKSSNYRDVKNVKNYRFDIIIDENIRSNLSELRFRGNNHFSSEELTKFFYRTPFELANQKIYDEKYYKEFITILKEAYLEKGFVNVFVEEPIVTVKPKSKDVVVEYRVREGARATVNKINFKGVPENIARDLKTVMNNKVKGYFNPLIFDEDLKKIINYLHKEGFYFSVIKNANTPSLVSYSNDNSQVDITLDIELDQRVYLDNIIIIGNRKTRSLLVKRTIIVKPGDLLSRNKIRASQTNLLSLGLFSSINITPVKSSAQKADLLISLKEKDFGLVELAPGIRTDLGFKFSGSLTYLNVDGMNKQLSLKGLVNSRFILNSLDERRQAESRNLLEYQTTVGFNENNIFNSDIDFNSTVSTIRRRFFAFDADIQRFNMTFTKQFASWFSASTKLQVESISQFDATDEEDHGNFQIGSMTPSVSFDFRDNPINPLKGAFFNLSSEFANPTFFSQRDEELVINYYKFVSRNKFYIPIENGVFAISLAAGVQKNLATDLKSDGAGGTITEGYIPDIKVFRLSGVDIVRGFEDDEINRLITNQDISEARVDDTAYMANLKIEPRFFINDSMMFGFFYDAGRVFVNEYDLSQLRSAAGVTFKYLTPVGSLDFDYGIKLLRKRDADGILESPGRLHVSIGFF
jgi:outer membrane protein insertion porin family